MAETMRGAVVSSCGAYRYSLTRGWAASLFARNLGLVLFVMLNPSKADGVDDDATIRRCVGFARLWGFTGLHVANLFGWRSTDARALLTVADPVGPYNDSHLVKLASHAGRAVLAWGDHGAALRRIIAPRAERVTALLRESLKPGAEIGCLGKCGSGAPRHPVRLPYSQPFELEARAA